MEIMAIDAAANIVQGAPGSGGDYTRKSTAAPAAGSSVLVFMAVAEVAKLDAKVGAEVDEKEGLLRSVVVASGGTRWRAT
ncbi:hypothetical protein PRNP1_006043 [Phytophthora ramorum]